MRGSAPEVVAAEPTRRRRYARLGRILLVFLRLGTTTYGGMWGATQKLEKDLVDRTGWLGRAEVQSLLIVSTLVPAPKFMSFSGLVGFKVAGWAGSLTAVFGLVLPASIMIATGAALADPEAVRGPLAPLSTSVGIAIVGLLFGNALHQLRRSRVSRRERLRGLVLSVVIVASILAGVPLIAAAVVGFVLGAVLIRPETPLLATATEP